VSCKAGVGETTGTKNSLYNLFQQIVNVEGNGLKIFNSLKISKERKSSFVAKSSQDQLILLLGGNAQRYGKFKLLLVILDIKTHRSTESYPNYCACGGSSVY
jgi:hypothetical protein